MAGEAYETAPPPDPGPWSYAQKFYRVELKQYQEFKLKPTVEEFLAVYEDEIREDIVCNKPYRYPLAIYNYYYNGGKPPMIKSVQGRFLTIATPILTDFVFEATASHAIA